MIRVCRTCGVEKSMESFRKLKNRDWWEKQCRECSNAEVMARNLANPERRAEILGKYNKNNRQAVAESKRKYSARNQEKRLESCRRWLQLNPEKRKSVCRNWTKSNPLKSRAYNANRRSRILSATGKHTKEDILRLFKAQSGQCANPICKVGIESKFEVDHIMPLYLGGANSPDNLQLLCKPCNRKKWKKHPEEWRKELERAQG